MHTSRQSPFYFNKRRPGYLFCQLSFPFTYVNINSKVWYKYIAMEWFVENKKNTPTLYIASYDHDDHFTSGCNNLTT